MTNSVLTGRSATVSVDSKLASLLEEAAQKLQRGESVDLADLALDHPSHADALRELLPTIAAMVGITRKSSDDSPSLAGIIGKYQLMAKLGEGGMGAVYMALHTELQKTVALKVLPAHRLSDPNAVARFRREIKAAGRFDHANIVRASDAGEENGTHFLVMEYIEGCDLSRLVRRTGPMPVADACQIIKLAADGLEFAHRHGLVHRDVKPSNIMVTPQGQVKILDLGLALLDGRHYMVQTDLTDSGQMIGTIDYMAPEQGSNSHAVDARVDVYSLGATLYQLLSGSAPFAGARFDTLVKKMNAMASVPAAPLDEFRTDVPKALATSVAKMLAKSPAERYTTAAELAAAVEPFSRGSDLPALLRGAPLGAAYAPPEASAISTSDQYRSEASDNTIDSQQRMPRPLLSPPGAPPSRRWRWTLIAAALLGPLVAAAIVLTVRDKSGNEKLRVTLDKNDVLEIKSGEQQKLNTKPAGSRATAPSGRFYLFAPGYGPESTDTLTKLFARDKKIDVVTSLNSLEEAAALSAGVLVVAMDDKAFEKVGHYDPETLKQRKIIGIGYGAAKLFGEMGLKINGGACAHGVNGPPRIIVQENGLVTRTGFESPMFVFDPPVLDPKDFHNQLFFGMYMGPHKTRSPDADVEIIALQTVDRDYAPIVRQGLQVMVCIDAPPEKWSADFRHLILATSTALDSHDLAKSSVKIPASVASTATTKESNESPVNDPEFGPTSR